MLILGTSQFHQISFVYEIYTQVFLVPGFIVGLKNLGKFYVLILNDHNSLSYAININCFITYKNIEFLNKILLIFVVFLSTKLHCLQNGKMKCRLCLYSANLIFSFSIATQFQYLQLQFCLFLWFFFIHKIKFFVKKKEINWNIGFAYCLLGFFYKYCNTVSIYAPTIHLILWCRSRSVCSLFG